jgi:general secretion pathway protein G
MLRPLSHFRSARNGMHIASRLTGFTLIEMVIVMALIALLLTLAVPRYFTAIDHGKTNVQQQNLATMRDAVDKFFGDQGRYPESLDELVKMHYLRNIPMDPITEKPDWIIIAPSDPTMSGVYDVRSAKDNNEPTPSN